MQEETNFEGLENQESLPQNTSFAQLKRDTVPMYSSSSIKNSLPYKRLSFQKKYY